MLLVRNIDGLKINLTVERSAPIAKDGIIKIGDKIFVPNDIGIQLQSRDPGDSYHDEYGILISSDPSLFPSRFNVANTAMEYMPVEMISDFVYSKLTSHLRESY